MKNKAVDFYKKRNYTPDRVALGIMDAIENNLAVRPISPEAWAMYLAKRLAPGGRLVFCTCSLLPDEGEVQVEEALASHPDMSVNRAALALPGIDPAWITEEGGLRLRPDFWADLGGLDGFYMACLQKAPKTGE